MKSYEYNSIFTPQEFQNFARDIIQIKKINLLNHLLKEKMVELMGDLLIKKVI